MPKLEASLQGTSNGVAYRYQQLAPCTSHHYSLEITDSLIIIISNITPHLVKDVSEKERQCTYNAILRSVRETVVAGGKQKVLRVSALACGWLCG
jgi:hypothetical protein